MLQSTLFALQTACSSWPSGSPGVTATFLPSRSFGVLIGFDASETTEGVAVEAAASWSDALVDALCAGANPWCQPVLDRAGRRIVLAPWPAGSRTLGADAPPGWTELLPASALVFDDPALAEAIADRLRPESLVCTPSGAWMLALDDLLAR